MSAVVDATRGKVQKYLTDLFGTVELDRGGGFGFRYHSTRVFVSVDSFGDDQSVVQVFAPVIINAPESDELYEEIACSGFTLGHLSISDGEGDRKTIVFAHRMLGDFLDPEELETAVMAVAVTADRLDDEFEGRFGGSKMFDSND